MLFDSVSLDDTNLAVVFLIPPVHTQKGESFAKLYNLGDEPERKAFLDKLIPFNEERGNTAPCPLFNKQVIDLYKFYSAIKEKGGFATVIKKKKMWKEVTDFVMGHDVSGPLTYTLKKHYIKHILPYECKFDLGGIDLDKYILQVDPPKEKKKPNNKNAPSPCAVDSNSQSSYPQATTPVSSDGSNLSSSNKSQANSTNSVNATNGQSNQRSATPTTLKDSVVNNASSNEINNKFSPANSLKQPFDPKFNPNNSLNTSNNQKQILPPNSIPNYPPGAQPIHAQNSQQMQFRPFPNDPNLVHPNSTGVQDNQSNANNLNHNEQSSNVPAYHLNSPADHYQNMSRTHSPLAQRLMQQKSPVVSLIFFNFKKS